MGLLKKMKEMALRQLLYRGLKRLWRRIDMDNLPELMKKKTTWAAMIGIVATVLAMVGQPELAAKAKEGAAAVATDGYLDDLKWLAAFVTAIMLRLGILKGK